TLSFTMSTLAARLRLFNAGGVQLTAQSFAANGSTAALRWVAPASGTYYLGVSGTGNTTYDPNVAGSGTVSVTGAYVLGIERLGAGTSHLTAITATAAVGTAAKASVASANTGQSITVSGAGLVAGD